MTNATNARAVEHEVGPHGEVHIGSHHGHVRVFGIDGGVARVNVAGGDRDLDRFEIDPGPGRLTVGASDLPAGGPLRGIRLGLGLGFGRSPELEVHVPRGARLRVDTTSGNVRTVGLDHRQEIRSVSGSITIEEPAGEIEVESMSGDIQVVDGRSIVLQGRTVAGEIDVRARRLERIEVNTMSGGVRIRAGVSGPGPYTVETVSGDLLLESPAPVRIQARTLSGGTYEERSPEAGRTGGADRWSAIDFRSMSGRCRVVGGQGEVEAGPSTDEVAWLEILRALERGEIDVDEAGRRLAAMEGDHER